MGLKSSRVLLFLILLILLPFIRGCADDFSLGFPLLTVGDSINFGMFLLNVLFIGIIYFLFIKYMDYWNKLYSKKEVRWGVYSVVFYHAIFLIGFFWFFVLKNEEGLLSSIFSWMSYPIFMFEGHFSEIGLAPLIDITIPNFYPKDGDIYFRIIYIITSIIYFIVGYFSGKIYQKIKPTANSSKDTTIEPEFFTSIKYWFISKWEKSVYWKKGAIVGLIGGICSIPLFIYDFFYINFLKYWHLLAYSLLGRTLDIISLGNFDQRILDTSFFALVIAIVASIIITIPLILIGITSGFLYEKFRKK